MTHLAHIATRLFNTPLLLTPEYASVVTSVLSDRVGVVPFAAEDSYEAVTLGEYEAKLLGCVPGAAAFHHQRRTTMENGLVYECTSSYMRGDRVRLDVCFQKSGTSFTRVVD